MGKSPEFIDMVCAWLQHRPDVRDELITGSFKIGEDGRKEPLDWKEYAKKLEQKLGLAAPNCTFLRMNTCKGYGTPLCYQFIKQVRGCLKASTHANYLYQKSLETDDIEELRKILLEAIALYKTYISDFEELLH